MLQRWECQRCQVGRLAHCQNRLTEQKPDRRTPSGALADKCRMPERPRMPMRLHSGMGDAYCVENTLGERR
jgi:hypothetical protein